MGRYLIRDGALQAGGDLPPMHRTESGILVVNSSDDPWGIGTGSDAMNPSLDASVVTPAAPDCEMRFVGDAQSASIVLRSAQPENQSGLVFTFEAEYQYDYENVSLFLRGDGWVDGQVSMAPRTSAEVLSLRYFRGVMQVLADGVALTSVDVREYVVPGYFGDVEAAIASMVPTAFGAAQWPDGSGHTAYGDQIIDVFYDGVIDDGPAGFWTQFRRCREVVS